MKNLITLFSILLLATVAQAQITIVSADNSFEYYRLVQNPVIDSASSMTTVTLPFTLKIEALSKTLPGKFEYSGTTQVEYKSNAIMNTAKHINIACNDTIEAIIERLQNQIKQ